MNDFSRKLSVIAPSRSKYPISSISLSGSPDGCACSSCSWSYELPANQIKLLNLSKLFANSTWKAFLWYFQLIWFASVLSTKLQRVTFEIAFVLQNNKYWWNRFLVPFLRAIYITFLRMCDKDKESISRSNKKLSINNLFSVVSAIRRISKHNQICFSISLTL